MSKKILHRVFVVCAVVVIVAGVSLITIKLFLNIGHYDLPTTTIQGKFVIERKTGSWGMVNGIILNGYECEGWNSPTAVIGPKGIGKGCSYLDKTVRVTGYMYKAKCRGSEQCWGGNFMEVRSITIIEADPLSCEVDGDCMTTLFPMDQCCARCISYPINKNVNAIQEKWRAYECAIKECPLSQCYSAPIQGVNCVNKICELCGRKGELVNPYGMNSKYEFPKKCCRGLKDVDQYQKNSLGECLLIKGNPYKSCVSCGDGICENTELENSCNCPEDCPTDIQKEISIVMDKTEYTKSDTAKIVVKNTTQKSIYYPSCAGTYLDLMGYKNGSWNLLNAAIEMKPCFSHSKELPLDGTVEFQGPLAWYNLIGGEKYKWRLSYSYDKEVFNARVFYGNEPIEYAYSDEFTVR